jgi:hypothetical protein
MIKKSYVTHFVVERNQIKKSKLFSAKTVDENLHKKNRIGHLII